ncbi:MAG: DUF692 domain-containing protein [Kofleriaceae bacterium]
MTTTRRVGLGFRPEIAVELMARPGVVDLVEVVAETCFTQRTTRREACALTEVWAVIPHGVKLSLGSADGVDIERARRLGALAKDLRAPFISEHVAFSRGGDVEIGHLTQLPRTRAAIAVVAANVDRVRRVFPEIPLYLENVAWSFLWPDDEMDEPTFYQEIVAATGCKLLLDLGNLYANAVNEGLDPLEVARRYPLGDVGMVHVAGGVREHGFYFDTHAHPIPSEVFALVAEVAPDVPVLIERDASFCFVELERELAALRTIATRPHAEALSTARAVTIDATASATLAEQQRELAGQLVRGESRTALAERIGADAMNRSRGILQRKRVDDALPLLATLIRQSTSRTRDVAAAVLASTPRPTRGAGLADAWRVAQGALTQPDLADAAAIDLLVLRARFTGPQNDGQLSPRVAPFIGSARTRDGRRIRAIKGIGARARVHLHETRKHT